MRMLPTPPVCPSCGSTTTAVPGPKGDKGDTGATGAKGDKGNTGDTGPVGGGAWTTLTEPFAVPGEYGVAAASVDDTSWMFEHLVVAMRPDSVLVPQPAAYFIVQSVVDGYTVNLYNPKVTDPGNQKYTQNPDSGFIPAGYKLCAAGVQGEAIDPTTVPSKSEYYLLTSTASIDLTNAVGLDDFASGFVFSTQDIGSGVATISTVATIPIAKGGTGQTSKTPAFNALAPLTTKGDIIYHDGTNCQRLAIGSAGQQLIVSSGAPAWGSVFPSITTFRSSEIAVPAAGAVIADIPHGLAGIPAMVDMYFKCIDAGGDQGYALGDTVPLAATDTGTGAATIPTGALYATSTHIKFTMGQGGTSGLTFCKPTDGTSMNPVRAKWKMVFTAIYYA